jgi:hypothetical protein
MTCEKAELLLAVDAVGGLSPVDSAELHRHLEGCADCRNESRLYLYASSMLAESVEPVAPPARLRSSLMARIHAEAAGRASTASARDGVRWYRRLWRAIPAGRPLTLAGGIATVVAVALAVWSLGAPGGSSSVAVRVPACGAASAPNASCLLVYDTAAHQSVLTVHGLATPATVAGTPLQTYELWLIPLSGLPAPAGLLTERPGSTEWSAAIAVDLSGYAALAATAESAPRGVLTPQGPEILRVPLSPPGGGRTGFSG